MTHATRRRRALPYIYGLLCASIFLGLEANVGVVIRPFDIGLVLILAVGFASRGDRGVFRPVVTPLAFWLFGLLLVIEVVNALFLVSRTTAIKEGLQNAESLVLLLALASQLVTTEDRETFFEAFIGGVAAIVAGTVLYYVAQGDYVRFKSIGDSRYAFGILTSLILVRLIAGPRRRQALWILALIVSVVLTLVSGERKGWVALVIAAVVVLGLALLMRRGGRGALRMIGLVGMSLPVFLAVAVLLQNSATSYVEKQIESMGDIVSLLDARESALYDSQIKISNRVRTFVLKRGIDYMEESPVFGIGTDTLKARLQYDFYFMPSEFIKGSHNEYLKYGVENGVPALIIYIVMWTVLLLAAIGNCLRSVGREAYTNLAILNLVVYGMIANLFMSGSAFQTMLAVIPLALVMGTLTEARKVRRRVPRQRIMWDEPQRGPA